MSVRFVIVTVSCDDSELPVIDLCASYDRQGSCDEGVGACHGLPGPQKPS